LILLPSIKIVDDLFFPEDRIVLNFRGYNPLAVCNIIKPLLIKILKVEAKDTIEKVFRWDRSSDPRSFYNFWTVDKEQDRWSSVFLKVVIQGHQHSKTKEGNVRIELYGWLETKYEYSNFLQRMVWLTYNRIFYYKKRRDYMDKGRGYVFRLKNELIETLKMPKIA